MVFVILMILDKKVLFRILSFYIYRKAEACKDEKEMLSQSWSVLSAVLVS